MKLRSLASVGLLTEKIVASATVRLRDTTRTQVADHAKCRDVHLLVSAGSEPRPVGDDGAAAGAAGAVARAGWRRIGHAAGGRDHAAGGGDRRRGDATYRAGGGRDPMCDHLVDGGANGAVHGRPGHGRQVVRVAPMTLNGVDPLTFAVRGMLLVAAAAIALFNGSLWSPFFDSVAYILYLT